MYTSEELTKREKDLKKAVRDLGGLAELFPELQKNYQDQIDILKKISKKTKTVEENATARFGKGAKLRKEAQAELSELELKLEELIKEQPEKEEVIKLYPTIEKSRADELAKMVDSFETDKIKELPLNELATAFVSGITKIQTLNSSENKNEILIEKYNAQQKELHKVFIDKLRECDEYFIAMSPATRAPYMDLREKNGQACLWIFTDEGYAKNCRNFFARQYIFLEIMKISKDDFKNFAKNLPRMGYNFFTLNNGVHNLTIELSALIGKVQYSCPINPTLHMRRLDFYQSLLLFNKVPQTNHKLYEQYHNPMLMKAKESVMLYEFYKAKYTLVMKEVTKTEDGKEVKAMEMPTNIKDDTRFILVFSDMLEFDIWKRASNFKTDEPGFKATAIGFEDLCRMGEDTGNEFLLDRNGWCFEFTKDKRENVKQVAIQVAKLEEERKKKEQNK